MNPVSPFDNTMQLLTKVLDLRASKQKVISSNIANAETPGYAPAKFEFEDQLKTALGNTEGLPVKKTHSQHISMTPDSFKSIEGKITRIPDKTGIGDENGVDVNGEMIDLSKNQLMYETAAKLLKKKLSMLKYAISDGR